MGEEGQVGEEGGYHSEGRKEEEDCKIVLHKLTHYIYVPCFDSFCCVLNFLIKWKKLLSLSVVSL